jgi:hypothetical protein
VSASLVYPGLCTIVIQVHRSSAMINFQDELAWLNHRLDDKLEEWRRVHQYDGRVFYASFNSILMLLVVAIVFRDKIWVPLTTFAFSESSVLALWLAMLVASLSLLIYSFLRRQLHQKLLGDGNKLKSDIYFGYLAKEGGKVDIMKYQKELADLLAMERSFPFFRRK